ncbi:MAG TPA: CHAT domain-containing protein, partial [Bryobacteraceae bacterium]|nr:CHAT domain-containing protein [Bryobacteraceae bacterium]
FYFSERSKGRVLLDVIGGDRTPATAITKKDRQREIDLRRSLSALNGQVMHATQAASRDEIVLAELKRSRETKRLEYEDFRANLYASHPELRLARAALPTVQAPEAIELLSSPSEAIAIFVAGPQRTWAFAITVSGIKSFELPVSTQQLGKDVDHFLHQLANRDLRAPETARRLYELVLGPLRATLHDKTELVIIPDGVLWNLPFQALRSGSGRYVIEDLALSYAPSVTILREVMRLRRPVPPPATFLAFGNPAFGTEVTRRERPGLMDGRLEPAPETELQVNLLGQWYGASSRVYVGTEAREERWKSESPRYGIVHIATHGVIDNRSPLYSHIVLARPEKGSTEDGFVEAWEILDMRLNARLVVLSACETARGQLSAGEGVIGLMWAFFVAGSPAQVVTQWRVDSASSAELLVAFHKEWNAGRQNISKARALQLASTRLLRSREYSHPFYWAGYILVGDHR